MVAPPMMRCARRALVQHQGGEDQPEQRRAGRLDGGAVAERHQDEAGIGDHRLRRAGQDRSSPARGPSRCRRGRRCPSRSASGISSKPDQKKRWKARSAGEKPTVMPCLAATKPAAQPSAAAVPHNDADQDAEASRRLRSFRPRHVSTLCAGDLRPADTLGSPAKSNREIKSLHFTREETLMAKSRKVIITCAVTGSIHTPSMSPHLPVTAAGDRRRRDRRGRSRRRHRPSARAQSAGRPSRPDAGGVRAVPQGDQAALRRGGEHHHRRRADHDGRGARASRPRPSSRRSPRSTWAR